MDDKTIEELEKALAELPDDINMVEPNITIADFCVDSVKEMMGEGQSSPRKRFHVLHAGSVYYIDMVVQAIAPPYEAREPGEDKQQWFGQRPT
jgi:hypothetical protein